MLSMFMEGVELTYLMIGFSDGGIQKELTKELGKPIFVSWSDLYVDDGLIFANGIPLSTFKVIVCGAVGDSKFMYASLKEYVESNKLKCLFYGCSDELDNKIIQSVRLKADSVSQIKTFISQCSKTSAIALIKTLKLPIVSKIVNGSQGKGIEKHDTKESLEKFLNKNQDELIIFQEFVPNDGDYRIFFFKDDFIYVIKRIKKDAKEFRNNVSLGGSQEFVELPNEAKALALAAVKALKFDVTGVDLIQNLKTKKWYVMEVNSAPQFSGPEFKQVISKIAKYLKSQ
jgi:RimK family alpha-L-glutamate ligase